MLRTPRERAFQTLCYEAGGFLAATPLYALFAGSDSAQSALLILSLSLAVMIWSPLHNSVFDLVEWRLCGRLASDRPHRLRLVHALSHEASSVLVTLPLIMLIGGLGFAEALLADLGLTALYAGYAYLFHLAYGRIRPVRAG